MLNIYNQLGTIFKLWPLKIFFEDDTLQESILDKEFEESLSEVKAQVLLEKFLDCYYSNYQSLSFKDEFDYKKHGNRIYVYLHDGPVVYYDDRSF